MSGPLFFEENRAQASWLYRALGWPLLWKLSLACMRAETTDPDTNTGIGPSF